MRKIFIPIFLCLILLLGACGQKSQEGALVEGVTPTPSPEGVILPGNPGNPGGSPAAETAAPAPTPYKSSLYDPSIFVIEAQGTYHQELAPGYYADYECEMYLHKIDANDNRAVAGSYQGVFWMNMTLDAQEFINDMLGDAPMNMNFAGGGEAVCDNLGISLNTTDDKAWTDYSIQGEDGNTVPLTRDSPVGKGSFVAVSKSVYLEAHGSGAQGVKIDYSDTAEGDLTDVNYVINVEPDSAESNAERKVVINISGEGFNFNMEGVLRRLPGYPEDVEDYYNSDGYKNSTWSRLQPNE
jgi:hypothetical protein